MEVVAIVGRTGARAYLVGCARSREAVLVGPLPEDRQAYLASAARKGWSILADLAFEPGPSAPIAGKVRVDPRQLDHGSIKVGTARRRSRLPLYVAQATLAPDPPPQLHVLNVGRHPVHALACVADPPELCWRIEGAVFTNRTLFSPGIWPAAATPVAVLALPSDTVVYPRRAQDGHTVSTVSMERVWLSRWESRGYRPEIPDPTATIRSSPDRRS